MESIQKNVGLMMMFLLLFVSLIPAPALAGERFRAEEGFFVGIGLSYNTIHGDFDGESILVSPGEAFIVPSVENDYGPVFTIGTRSNQGAFELSYLYSTHDITWLGAKGEAEFSMINLDGKFFFMRDQKLQPYLLFGIGLPWLKVKDGSTDLVSVDDATFHGIGFNIGTGFQYFVHRKVAITPGVTYRWITYSSVSGAGGDNVKIAKDLDGSGLHYNVGLIFVF